MPALCASRKKERIEKILREAKEKKRQQEREIVDINQIKNNFLQNSQLKFLHPMEMVFLLEKYFSLPLSLTFSLGIQKA